MQAPWAIALQREEKSVGVLLALSRAIDALNLVIADIRSYILRLQPTLDKAMGTLVKDLSDRGFISIESKAITIINRELPPSL